MKGWAINWKAFLGLWVVGIFFALMAKLAGVPWQLALVGNAVIGLVWPYPALVRKS
jgi:hypothetical protein